MARVLDSSFSTLLTNDSNVSKSKTRIYSRSRSDQ